MHRLEVSTPSETEILMTRKLDAPLDLVWRAYSEPALIRRWLLGPEGHTMPECEVDFRTGGRWRYVWLFPDGETRMEAHGEFLEIAPKNLIRHTETFPDFSDMASQIVTRFSEAAGVTTVEQSCDYGSRAARDAVLKSGMETGVEASFQRLDRIAATEA